MAGHPRTLYEQLGVAPAATLQELKAAYRRRARAVHPDLRAAGAGPQGDRDTVLEMAAVNAAWHALSDPARRLAYDATLPTVGGLRPDRPPPAAPRAEPSRRPREPVPRRSAPPTRSRKEAWIASVRAQIRHLSSQAARSATQTMLVRHHGRSRADFERVAASIVESVCLHTGDRIRDARGTGAAPLDLALVAALVGLRVLADEMVRSIAAGSGQSCLADEGDRAEMIDRMWETMAYELPHELVIGIGQQPKLLRAIRARR